MFKNDEYTMVLPGQTEAEEAVQELIKKGSGGFTKRLTVAHGISKCVTEGKAVPRDLMLGDKNVGKSIVAVIGSFRSHATQFDTKENKLIAESFDANSDVFRDIQRKQKRWVKGAGAGPEFIIYIPSQGCFATMHFTRGSLEEAGEAVKRQGKLVRITTQLTGNPRKRQWPIFKIEDAAQVEYTPPSEEDYKEAMEQFVAPLKEKEGNPAGSRPR